MKKALSIALVLIVLVTAFAACTPVEEKITGTWTYTETVLSVVTEKKFVFNADGTGTVPGELTGLFDINMTWSISDKNLTVDSELYDPVVYTFELKGDTLTLTKADGSVLTLTRATA
ncbi:MAG: hypothetical protein IKL10_04575 [Clostridia bacterium]|nr:hypothetical protein [Clostridia bacterium]